MDIQELQHLLRCNEKVSAFPDQRNIQCHYPLLIEENGKEVITAHSHICSSIPLAYTSYSASSNCISVQRRTALPNTTYTLFQIQDVVYHRCVGHDHTQSFRLFCVYWKQIWWRYLIIGRKRDWDVVCVCVSLFRLALDYFTFTEIRHA
jgi:hypothetical protein